MSKAKPLHSVIKVKASFWHSFKTLNKHRHVVDQEWFLRSVADRSECWWSDRCDVWEWQWKQQHQIQLFYYKTYLFVESSGNFRPRSEKAEWRFCHCSNKSRPKMSDSVLWVETYSNMYISTSTGQRLCTTELHYSTRNLKNWSMWNVFKTHFALDELKLLQQVYLSLV